MMNYSVSDLLAIIKDTIAFESKLQNIYVKGEITNFSVAKGGHVYFSLKDSKAKINCVMFSNRFNTLTFKPKDGTSVLVYGSLSVYEVTGQIQINVFRMEDAGLGDLYLQYEKLKNKLEKEGLFAKELKKALPLYPERIAVVTGKDSAACADIKTNFNRRWPLAQIDIFYSIVQGSQAPSDLIRNLILIDESSYDLAIIARGGGSFEDLNCFNDELLVRTIFSLKTPIVAGVGHESDVTLTDFVADLRAPTPTAAVELTTPNINDVKRDIRLIKERMETAIRIQSNNNKLHLKIIKQNFHLYLGKQNTILSNYRDLISRFNNFSNDFKKTYSHKLQQSENSLEKAMLMIFEKQKGEFKKAVYLLDAFSPLKILSRGYSLTYHNDKIITSSKEVAVDDEIVVKLSEGVIRSIVKENK